MWVYTSETKSTSFRVRFFLAPAYMLQHGDRFKCHTSNVYLVIINPVNITFHGSNVIDGSRLHSAVSLLYTGCVVLSVVVS